MHFVHTDFFPDDHQVTPAREGAGARYARPNSSCSSRPILPFVVNVARVYWVVPSRQISNSIVSRHTLVASEGVGRAGGSVLAATWNRSETERRGACTSAAVLPGQEGACTQEESRTRDTRHSGQRRHGGRRRESCAGRVGDVPRSPRVVPSTKSSRFRSSSSGRLRGRSATRSSTPSMGTRWPRPPGLLLGASDSEFTSPTTTTWNRRWSGAAADEPGRPHTDLEARLERLFVRGREMAGTLVRPEVDILQIWKVAPHRSAQTPRPDDGSQLAQQACCQASRIGRARCAQPETSGLHAGPGTSTSSGALEGNAHTGTTMVCSLPTMGSPGGPSMGFSRRPLFGVSRRRCVNWGPPRRVTVTRRMVVFSSFCLLHNWCKAIGLLHSKCVPRSPLPKRIPYKFPCTSQHIIT